MEVHKFVNGSFRILVEQILNPPLVDSRKSRQFMLFLSLKEATPCNALPIKLNLPSRKCSLNPGWMELGHP